MRLTREGGEPAEIALTQLVFGESDVVSRGSDWKPDRIY